MASHAKNPWTFLISATPSPLFCASQPSSLAFAFSSLLFLPFDRKLNASTSNDSELRECFGWKNQTKFKILWPSLAAYTLGMRSQTDLETGHSGSAEMMAHEIQCSVSMPYINVPG